MFEFSSLNKVVFQTIDSLENLVQNPSQDLQSITDELSETNQALIETIDQSNVSEAAMKALTGLRKDLREEVIRNISRQLLTNIPSIQIQAGTAQVQQNLFSKELKKFEERLQYVLKGLKKSRGDQASQVEQDSTT